MTYLSVIVPVFNESENLRHFLKELNDSLSLLNKDYEIIVVDDGSTDDSFEILSKLKNKFPIMKLFKLRKNYGKSIAYLVGIEKSVGSICLTIDSDGQDVPTEIEKLLKKISEGYDVVVGRRINRKDSVSKKTASLIWNYFLRLFSKVNLHDVDCGLKAFRKYVLKRDYLRGDFHRYLPVAIAMDGYLVTEVDVIHRQRKKGKSKYNFKRIFPAVFDFITNIFMARFGYKPMHLFGSVGLFILTFGMLINLYLFCLKLAGFSIGGRPLLILGLLLTMAGLQLVFTGFLADLVIKKEEFTADDFLPGKN